MTVGRAVRVLGATRPAWEPGEVPRWRGSRGVDRLLFRAVLLLAVLLALVIVTGVARRALAMPAVSPASAAGMFWLVGCVAALGWLALVAIGASRDGGAERGRTRG